MAQIVDPRGKARHCTLMLLSAGVLADTAPEILQRRGLARYVFMFADELLLWVRRWRNQVRRSGTAIKAPAVDDLARAVDAVEGVRDILAAKRQAAAAWRADDMEATRALWEAVSPANASALADAALRSWEQLSGEDATRSVIPWVALDPGLARRCNAALPHRDADHWYLAADTSADLRPYTLPAAQGAELGRRIAEINDVAEHLDVLIRLAPIVYGHLAHDWLVRSALILEVSSLLDLTLGPAPGEPRNVMFPLIDLCRRFDAHEAASELGRLASGIVSGWDYVRWARNKLAAHIDDQLPIAHLHDHLAQLDYRGIVKLAERILNWLDVLGCGLELKLLVLGERRIGSWSTDATKALPGQPKSPVLRGALVRLFRNIDSPFMIATGSSMGSAIVAGITSGRMPRPRPGVNIPPRWDPLLHPRTVRFPSR